MGDGPNGWSEANENDDVDNLKSSNSGEQGRAPDESPDGSPAERPSRSHDAVGDDGMGRADGGAVPEGSPAQPSPNASTSDKSAGPEAAGNAVPPPAPQSGRPLSAAPNPSPNRRAGKGANPPTSRTEGKARAPHARYVQPAAPVFQVHGVSNFLSTSRVPRHLDTLISGSLERNARLEHILIHGLPGSGTTLLAQALIKDYAPRNVIELDAALGCDQETLRRSIDEVAPRGVLFIRHIEVLDGECDQMLAEFLAGRSPRLRRPRGIVDPSESELDRVISSSASSRASAPARRPHDVTLVATAHVMAQVGYIVRTRIEHMFHLREDPKALRNAVLRALRHREISIDPCAISQLERVLKSLTDSAEQIARATILRAESEGIRHMDLDTMRSILEEDLACRLPDEAYSSSLRKHLAGRRIDEATPAEIARIEAETGWGAAASESAIHALIREESRRRVA
jgi:DNA polymerase III delta prime subunit